MKNNAESMIRAAILQQQEEVRQRLSAVPEETPSPELEARLAGLQKKMVRRQFFNNIGRVSACLLGAVVICFGLLFAFKPTVRAAFVRWVKEIYENTIVYQFYGKPDEEYHMPDIVPGWLPEGMVLIQEDFVPDSSCTRVYENAETGKLIVLGYDIVMEGRNTTVSGMEGYEYEQLDIYDINIGTKSKNFEVICEIK